MPLESAKPDLLLRLAEQLEREMYFCGSYQKLEQAIAQANRNLPRRRIDRRKISRIVNERRSESLTLDELQALDTYLLSRGSGLSQLFHTPNIVREIVETGRLACLLPSKPRLEDRVDVISRWDIKALGELLLAIGKTRAAIDFAIEDVVFRSSTFVDGGASLPTEPWHGLLGDDQPSLICLGSPRACHASELMLARMFGVEPFISPDRARFSLPFCFVWPQDLDARFRSSFAVSATELRRVNSRRWKQRAPVSDDTWALIVGDEILDATQRGRKWKTYGIVAAQRRPAGQIWIVVAGLTGPASYAAAKIAAGWAEALPRTRAEEPSRTVWIAVEALVENTAQTLGDPRTLTDARPISESGWWPNEPKCRQTGLA